MGSVVGLWCFFGLMSIFLMWGYSVVFQQGNDSWMKLIPLMVLFSPLSISLIIALWITDSVLFLFGRR